MLHPLKLTLCFSILCLKLCSQINHEVGLKFTFENYLDGKGWGIIDDSRIRLPGIYYQLTWKKQKFRVGYEKNDLLNHYDYNNTDVSSKEIVIRSAYYLLIGYNYLLYNWKNFDFSLGGSFVGRKNYDVYFTPLSPPSLEKGIFIRPFEKEWQIGNSIQVNNTFTVLKQLTLMLDYGMLQYYNGEFKNTFFIQTSIGYKL